MKDETREWVARAEEHLRVAAHLLEIDYPAQCIFFCEQALEVLLKAIWIERATEGLPRRTHDLVSLAEELALKLPEDWLEFLRRLAEQYMPTRYVDVPQVEYSREMAENYYEHTREIFAWLRQLLN